MLSFDETNQKLYDMMPHVDLLAPMDLEALPHFPGERQNVVCLPDDTFRFLHEAAIISFGGVLFAAWYNCPILELNGFTPIRCARSYDDGKTWERFQTVAADESGAILYCPPVFGIDSGRLYMLVNEMVAPDHIHALDLFVFDPISDRFEQVWTRPIPFKLNTNVSVLPNGRAVVYGRVAELDGFPNTPAVLVSDNGHIDADWYVVKMQQDGNLPDGMHLVHPETSAYVAHDSVFTLCRDDERTVPLVYVSEDMCQTFKPVIAHNIPFANSKIYAGTLSNGVNYAIGNLTRERTKLAIFFTQPGSAVFTKGFMLQDGPSETLGMGVKWHYPVAYEANGNLYIIYTMNTNEQHRGAALTVLPLANL